MSTLEQLQTISKIKDETKLKDYLMKSCSYIDLIDIIVSFSKGALVDDANVITINEYDFAQLEQLFYKTFRVPQANGRGRKSNLNDLTYEERIMHIANNPNWSREMKENKLKIAYLNEVRKNYESGNFDVVTIPILDNLLDENYKWE